MLATAPQIAPDEVRRILQDLALEKIYVPEPQSVKVEAGEDHSGNPAIFMTVTFSKRHRPEDIPWGRISPLVTALRRRIFVKDGETRPVISEVRRLAEKLPKT